MTVTTKCLIMANTLLMAVLCGNSYSQKKVHVHSKLTKALEAMYCTVRAVIKHTGEIEECI